MRPECLDGCRMDVVYFNQFMYTERSIPFATWNFQNFNPQFLVYLVKCPFAGLHLRQTTLRQKHNGIRRWFCRYVCSVNMLT